MTKSDAQKQQDSLREDNRLELDRQKYLASLELKHQQKLHSTEIKNVVSNAFQEQRTMNKAFVNMEQERDAAVAEKEAAVSEKFTAVKTAVKDAKQEERQHYSKVLQEEKSKQSTLNERAKEHTSIITNLLQRSHAAEKQRDRSTRDAQQSARRSSDLNSIIQTYEKDLKEKSKDIQCLQGALYEMSDLMEQSTQRIQELEDAMPIQVIKRTRTGRGGNSSWQPFMWDLIMEALINGTPPSAVRANIQLHIQTFAPFIDTVELPSLWTIRRARTVILVITQTLAAYRLAKADKWGQVFTDATSRRQVSFQNLLISIEEDELYR